MHFRVSPLHSFTNLVIPRLLDFVQAWFAECRKRRERQATANEEAFDAVGLELTLAAKQAGLPMSALLAQPAPLSTKGL